MVHEGGSTDDPFAGYANIKGQLLRLRGGRFNMWQDVGLPIAARRHGATVLHAPANTAPYYPLSRLVMTIHDLIPLEMEPDSPATGKWLRRVRRGAHRARRIITPSEWSKRQIVTHLGVAPEKVVVNYWAPDRACHKVEDSDTLSVIREKYGIPRDQRYVLGFGGSDPRKNTRRIVEAWARVPKGIQDAHVLLLIGNQEPAWSQLLGLVTTLGVGSTCRLHGFASETDIAPLLSGAAALCYPSLSEGFGLPLVDAFQCDTPILTSRTTSLGEIAGNAGLTIDPGNTDEITAGLVTLLSDERLVDQLRHNGRIRRTMFSWTTCAETVGAAIESAAQ